MEGAFGVNSICGTPGPEGRVNLCRSLGRVRFKGAVPEPAGGRSRKTRFARPGRRDPCSPAPPGPDPRSSDPRPLWVPISGTPLRDPPLPFPAPGAQTSSALGTSALWSPHPTPPHRARAALVLDHSRCPRPRPQAWSQALPTGKGSAPATPTPGPPLATCCLGFSRQGATLPPRVTSWPCARGKAQEGLWDQPGLPLPSGRASGVERARGPQPAEAWEGSPDAGPIAPGAGGRGPHPCRAATRTLGEERALLGSDHPTFPRPPRGGLLRGV